MAKLEFGFDVGWAGRFRIIRKFCPEARDIIPLNGLALSPSSNPIRTLPKRIALDNSVRRMTPKVLASVEIYPSPRR